MDDVTERLAEIAKIEDPYERADALVAYCQQLMDGTWRETLATARAAAEDGEELPDLPAEAEEDVRRQLDTIVNRATADAEQLFAPQRRRVGRRRGVQQHI